MQSNEIKSKPLQMALLLKGEGHVLPKFLSWYAHTCSTTSKVLSHTAETNWSLWKHQFWPLQPMSANQWDSAITKHHVTHVWIILQDLTLMTSVYIHYDQIQDGTRRDSLEASYLWFHTEHYFVTSDIITQETVKQLHFQIVFPIWNFNFLYTVYIL